MGHPEFALILIIVGRMCFLTRTIHRNVIIQTPHPPCTDYVIIYVNGSLIFVDCVLFRTMISPGGGVLRNHIYMYLPVVSSPQAKFYCIFSFGNTIF